MVPVISVQISDGPELSAHPLAAALQRGGFLSNEELAALESLSYDVASFRAGEPILQAGDHISRCFLILEGFVSTSREVDAHKRQITSLHLPGDFPILFTQPGKPLDVDVVAISACRFAVMDGAALLAICRQHFRIAEHLWQCALAMASIYREWIINVGHRPAVRKLAHLMYEIVTRLEALGMSRDKVCDFPLTQTHVSQATGLTRIHVNRACQELKKLGLVSMEHGRLTVHDWESLTRMGQFSPGYLCLPVPHWKASNRAVVLAD